MGIKGVINGEIKLFGKPKIKNNEGLIVEGNIKFKDNEGNLRKAFSNKYKIIINCNVDNAKVEIDNTVMGYISEGYLTIFLEPGTYNIIISKEEYNTNNMQLIVTGNKEITMNLISSDTPTGNMIIQCSVPAKVYFDGNYRDTGTEIVINTTFESHSLKIMQDDYITIDTTIDFNQDNQIFPYLLQPLIPSYYNLTINSNISATVLSLTDSKGNIYNSITTNGKAEFSLLEGYYTIKGEYICPNTNNIVETISSLNLKNDTNIDITLPNCPNPVITPQPTIPTISISSITSNSAKINISSNNATNYTIKINGTIKSNNNSYIATGLTPSTTYTVTAIATNTSGSSTSTKTFTTNDVSAPIIYDKEASFMSDDDYGIALLRFKSTSESHNYFKVDVDLISKNDSNGVSVYSTSNLDTSTGSGKEGWIKVKCHIPNYPSWVKFKVKVRSYYNSSTYSNISEKSFKVQIVNSKPDFVQITTI